MFILSSVKAFYLTENEMGGALNVVLTPFYNILCDLWAVGIVNFSCLLFKKWRFYMPDID